LLQIPTVAFVHTRDLGFFTAYVGGWYSRWLLAPVFNGLFVPTEKNKCLLPVAYAQSFLLDPFKTAIWRCLTKRIKLMELNDDGWTYLILTASIHTYMHLSNIGIFNIYMSMVLLYRKKRSWDMNSEK
jgi:hypothetical protein